MSLIATPDAARSLRVTKPIKSPDGMDSFIHRSDIIIEARESGSDTPNAKLIEQPANSVLQAHYHCVDQFQVVVAGSGWIGRHEATPLTVHFAGAYTGYGPIKAGAHGLHYLVFRLGVDSGAAYLPEARSGMKAVPRRHEISRPIDPGELPAPNGPGIISTINAIDADQEGAAHASIHDLPPDTPFAVESPSYRGSFVYLIEGEAKAADSHLGAGSCIALAPAESLLIKTMARSAKPLFMKFPRSVMT